MVPLPSAFLARPIAHRGLHDARAGRPENSLAAAEAAIAGGYGIEIDLQLSADGVAMVFHDAGLSRMTQATGSVDAHTAAGLSALALRGSDGGIPTLAALLDLVAGRAPLLVEIKDRDGALGPATGPLEEAACADLAGYPGPVALMSFNPHSVAALAVAAPHLPRGLVTCGFAEAEWPALSDATRARLRTIPDAASTGAGFVSHDARDLANPRLAELRAAGLAVLCWTVRSPTEEAAARQVAQNVTFEGYAP